MVQEGVIAGEPSGAIANGNEGEAIRSKLGLVEKRITSPKEEEIK